MYLIKFAIFYYVQKQHIFREKSKYAPNKNLQGNFCARRKAVNFCHPDLIEIPIMSRFEIVFQNSATYQVI